MSAEWFRSDSYPGGVECQDQGNELPEVIQHVKGLESHVKEFGPYLASEGFSYMRSFKVRE
jgi:hypothetical protein